MALREEPALAEFYKTGAGAKTIQARLKANPIVENAGWNLRTTE